MLATCATATGMSACGGLPWDGGGNGGPRVCLVGDERCNSSGHREVCAPPGNWMASDFVCTTNVAVDDETGIACATKADGQFRCWGGSGLNQLPPDSYRRVQTSPHGPIGLTSDGRVVAPGLTVPSDLPPIIELRSNNMGGAQGLCYRSALDSSFTVFVGRPGLDVVVDPNADPLESRGFRSYGGPFLQASCAFEGLAFGVRADGTAWDNILSRMSLIAGPGWQRLAFSVGFECGLRPDGQAICVSASLLEDVAPFTFTLPSGPYQHIATSYRLACGVSTTGNLSCLNARGQVVPTPPGRYTFVDAGRHVVCAIRAAGTSACWHEWPGTDELFETNLVTRLDPIEAPIEPGW